MIEEFFSVKLGHETSPAENITFFPVALSLLIGEDTNSERATRGAVRPSNDKG